MDLAQALAAEELWGWPVDVLDRLLVLRKRAWDGSLPLEQWREQDAALRAGLPAVDRDEVRDFQYQLIVDEPPDAPGELRTRLSGRLTALAEPAPSDEELWQNLAAAHESLTSRNRDPRSERMYRAQRDRITAWLTRPDGGLDPATGLPWAQVARYRTVDNPDLGQVPQYVDAARHIAIREAPAEDRERADLVHETTKLQNLAWPIADLNQEQLTWLPRLLLAAAEQDHTMQPLIDEFMRIWSDPKVQQLLIRETSRGWPPSIGYEPATPTT